MGHPVYGWSLSPSCLMYSFNDVCWTIESLTNLTSDVLKAIGRAKAGRGEEPVAKFRKFEKIENTFTLKIRET